MGTCFVWCFDCFCCLFGLLALPLVAVALLFLFWLLAIVVFGWLRFGLVCIDFDLRCFTCNFAFDFWLFGGLGFGCDCCYFG